jgi:predicted transcriptional regulator
MKQVIQQTFATSGMSIKKLSEITHLPYAAVYGAVKGSTDSQLNTIEPICKVLGLELRPVKKAKKDD